MKNLPAKRDHLAFLREIAANLRDAQSRSGISAEERGRYRRWLDHAASLEALLQMGHAQQLPADGAEADLPPALVKELSPRKRDRLEQQIVAVLAACNGHADLDQVLIGLYRGFDVIEKRRVIQNKLWRLVRTGRICKAKNSRNVFSLTAPKRQKRDSKRR